MVQAYNTINTKLPVNKVKKVRLRKINEPGYVYDNVINLSKRMPFYKINLTQESKEYSLGIKDAAYNLKEKLINMAEAQNPSYQRRTIAVSNEKVLSAYLISEDISDLPELLEIKVKKLSTIQINKGKELLATSRGLAPGTYEFVAKAGRKVYKLLFFQEQKRDNLSVLYEMASLLNNSIPGLNAVVESGSDKNYYRLSISCDLLMEEGGKLIFEDSDNHKIGVVDYLGLNRIHQEPTPARFELNGEPMQSSSNAFKLDNKLYIRLKEESTDPVYIRLVPDSKEILKEVESLFASYNRLVDIAKKHMEASDKNVGAKKLISELKELAKEHIEELTACGVGMSDDGRMYMDEELAAFAALDRRMEKLFCSDDGYFAALMEKAEAIAMDPVEYIDKVLVTYTDYKKANYRFPYITSMYSGIFYNVIC